MVAKKISNQKRKKLQGNYLEGVIMFDEPVKINKNSTELLVRFINIYILLKSETEIFLPGIPHLYSLKFTI